MRGVRRFEDLIAWQRAMELGDLVDAMTCDGTKASYNHKFTEQIQAASAKPAAQIAEGFLRYKPKESAYLYSVARASIGETQTHLERGRRRGYWTKEDFDKARAVSDEAMRVTTGLVKERLEAIAEAERKPRG